MTKRDMTKKRLGLAALALALAVSGARPAVAQDAKTVIANAAKAMGSENLTSISYYGSGANFGLGQSNNANGQWPRTNVSDYVRSIDFAQSTSRATGQTFSAPVTGGPAAANVFQQNITPANTGWAQQLEIWITPWGFLKGAAANNGTAKAQTIGGKRYTVVTWDAPQKAPSGIPYKVVGYINGQNLVEKVETWLENPIFGDMLVESLYSEYRDANGVKYPAAIVQKRGGMPTFEAQILGINANPRNIAQLVTPPAPAAGGRGGAPGGAPGGCRRPDLGEARRRRLPHQRRLQRARRRVRRSHRALRTRPAERSAVDGDHRGSQEGDSRTSRFATG